MYSSEELNRLFQQALGFTASGNRANRVAVANLEKLTHFQLAALRSYTELGLERLRAASEIADLQGLHDFHARQWEVATTVHLKLLDDARALLDIGAGFKADLDGLAQDSAASLTTAAEEKRAA